MTFSHCLQYSSNMDIDLQHLELRCTISTMAVENYAVFKFLFLFVCVHIIGNTRVDSILYFLQWCFGKRKSTFVLWMNMCNVELYMESLHVDMSLWCFPIKYFTWACSPLITWKTIGFKLSRNWQMFSFAKLQKYAQLDYLVHYYGILEFGKIVNIGESKLEKK